MPYLIYMTFQHQPCTVKTLPNVYEHSEARVSQSLLQIWKGTAKGPLLELHLPVSRKASPPAFCCQSTLFYIWLLRAGAISGLLFFLKSVMKRRGFRPNILKGPWQVA